MKINRETILKCSQVVLVPYRKQHVSKYHDWMKSAELQELTASEPLTLEQEYEIQQSWLHDDDKCTFIVLDAAQYSVSHNEIESMIGDVNLFLNAESRDEAEIEIMIAEPTARGRGCGKQALLAMLYYGMEYLNVRRFSAKIGFTNETSIRLFKKLGFQEISRCEYFKEITLTVDVSRIEDLLRTEATNYQIDQG